MALPVPSELGLPYDAWRLGQPKAIRTITAPGVTVLQAPTGTGKSAIALGAARLDTTRHVILTSTKGLQDQYARTAPWIADVRGMRNYPCHAANDEFANLFGVKGRLTATCDDGPCRADHTCSLKDDGCAYFDAYRQALASRTLVTSYAYWLASRLHGKGLGPVSRLICDEAHDAIEQLASALQIRVPEGEIRTTRRPRTIKQWREWALSELGQKVAGQELHAKLRHKSRQERLGRLATITEGWAVAHENGAYLFEPVDVRPYLSSLIGGVPSVTLMSATITEGTIEALGLDRQTLQFHAMRMRFPVEARPVYAIDGGRIDFRSEAQPENVRHWLTRMDDVISMRLDRKGLIHPISYTRQQIILAESEYKHLMIAPRSSADLGPAIERFRQAAAPCILVSPAVTTGFDFPYTDAEYQIIVKVPFPNTRSAIAKARVKTIPHYRELVAMQVLVQTTGRIMRSVDDQGETFILDEHFRWFRKQAAAFAPSWFLDAVIVTRRIPTPPPALTTR
jgi:Rad3-related DNA helicase